MHLYIVAGPNGAGKSLFSATLTSTDFEVFDGDKYIARLKQQFPETGSDIIENRVNEYDFTNAKEKAIQLKKRFAFETNFSSSDPTRSLKEFKAAGYKVHLIFMGMGSLSECIQRVSIRVKAGGHKVSEESIIYNFEHGYRNLYSYFNEFDVITLFDNSIPSDGMTSIPKKILHWEKSDEIIYFEEHIPEWVKKFVKIAKAV